MMMTLLGQIGVVALVMAGGVAAIILMNKDNRK